MQSCAARLGGLSQPHTHRGTSALAQGRRALTISAVAAPVKEPETLNAPMGRGLGGAAAPRPTPVAVQGADRPASTTGRVVLESEAELRSTTTQRAWVCGGMALMAATLAEGLAHVQVGGRAPRASERRHGAGRMCWRLSCPVLPMCNL